MSNTAFSVFTLGDTTTFRYMLEAVALIFQDPFFSSNAALGLGYGVFFGALILMLIMIYQAAFNKKIDISTLLLPLFAYLVLTGPKVDVKIIDTYNVAHPQIVSNIPIGLALPLTVASGVAYVFSTALETAYSTPDSPRVLTDGFMSPLRTLYALRYVNLGQESPYISKMVDEIYKKCIIPNDGYDMQEYQSSPDGLVYFNNFLQTKSVGLVSIRDADGTISTMSCKKAGDKLISAFEGYVSGDGSGGVDMKTSLSASIANIMQSQDKSGSPLTIKTDADIADAFAKLTDQNAANGRQFIMNTLFNQTLNSAAACASQKSQDRVAADAAIGVQNYESASQCTSWVSATEQLAENNAAAATGMVKVLQDGQNILVIIAILLFPLVVIMIMFQGKASAKSITSYVIYLASVYMWLPMAVCINFYINTKMAGVINSFTSQDTSNTINILLISDYGSFYEAISNSLSLANGLLASLPIFCMMFFSGMSMGAMAIMNRWNVGQSKYYDSSSNAVNAVAPSPIISGKSMVSSNGVQPMSYTSGGHAFDGSATQKSETSQTRQNALRAELSIAQAQLAEVNRKIEQAQGKRKSGSSSLTNHTNMQSHNESHALDGKGYQIQTVDSNKQTISTGNSTTDAKVGTGAETTSMVANMQSSAGLRIGINFGQDQQLQSDQLLNPMDANNVSMQNQSVGQTSNGSKYLPKPVQKIPLIGGLVNLLSSPRVKKGVELGASETGQLREVTSVGEQKAVTKLDNLGTFTSEESNTATRRRYQINSADSESNISDGKMQEKTISVSKEEFSANSTAATVSKALALEKKEALSRVESIEQQLRDEVGFSMTTTLQNGDVLSRIGRFDSVAERLAEINMAEQAKDVAVWESARAQAEHMAISTGVGGLKYSNEELYSNFITFFAASYVGGETASAAMEAVTGIESNHRHLDRVLNASAVDWDGVGNELNRDTDAAMTTVDKMQLSSIKVDDLSGMEVDKNITGVIPVDTSASAFTAGNELAGGHLRPVGSIQEQWMARTYNALLDAGFKPKAARIMIAQIGRESSFSEKNLFGSHNDPAKKHIRNVGLISWNQSRRESLDAEMKRHGLIASGGIGNASYKVGQESLNVQARFMYKEMTEGANNYKKAFAALNNDNLTDRQKHDVVGEKYIVWRITDENFSTKGKGNITAYSTIFDKLLANDNKVSMSASNLANAASGSSKAASGVPLGTVLGVVGNSGAPIGKRMGVHLDIRYHQKQSNVKGEVSDAHLARIGVGSNSRNLTQYRNLITSHYGKRHSDTGSDNHVGTDFALDRGTKLVNNSKVAITNVSTFYQAGGAKAGGGYVTNIRYADGVVLQLLHQDESMKGIVGTFAGKQGNNKGTTASVTPPKAVIQSVKSNITDFVTGDLANNQKIRDEEYAKQQGKNAAALKDDFDKYISAKMGINSYTKAPDGGVTWETDDNFKLLKSIAVPVIGIDEHKNNIVAAATNLTENINHSMQKEHRRLLSEVTNFYARSNAGRDAQMHTNYVADVDNISIWATEEKRLNSGVISHFTSNASNAQRALLDQQEIKKFSLHDREADEKRAISLAARINQREQKVGPIKENNPDAYAPYAATFANAEQRDLAQLNELSQRNINNGGEGFSNLVRVATTLKDK